jgi:predicted MPP superfamily phosphohydrolase
MQPDAGIMQSVIIPKTSKLVFVGDLHGDVVSLVNNINRMKEDGVFTSQTKRERDGNTLRLHNDYYLIFTGDYTDRGYHGIEVWQILLQLLINNPGKVFLLKGNHDQPAAINNPWDFVFRKEITLKYPNDHESVF